MAQGSAVQKKKKVNIRLMQVSSMNPYCSSDPSPVLILCLYSSTDFPMTVCLLEFELRSETNLNLVLHYTSMVSKNHTNSAKEMFGLLKEREVSYGIKGL